MRRAANPAQTELPLHDAPLPGSVMPRNDEHRLVPKKVEISNDRAARPKPHYSDGDDKDQTIPI